MLMEFAILSPLLFDKTVEEEFPLAATADVPTDMTRAEVEAVMAGMAKTDAPAGADVADGMAQADALKSGVFQDADRFHKGSGDATLYPLQDGSALLRFENSYGKAFAALGMGRSSKLVLQKYREKPKFMENLEKLSDGPIFLEGGAQLILDEHGEGVGSMGITGDSNEMDDECAFAAIRGTGFHVDENQYEGE